MGGRIRTVHNSKLDVPIELGAEFVHGRPEVTWKLLRQAGLLAYDLPFAHRRRRRGRLVEVPDINRELSKAMGGLAHLGSDDQSFADYLRHQRSRRSTAEAKRFAIHFVQGFDAADPERISAKSLAAEQEGIGDVENETQFRLVRGYGALIDYLRRSLDPKRVEIRLRLPVSEIHWRKSSVEVRSSQSRATVRATRALITLPLGVLQIPPEMPGAVRFSPDIAAWRDTASQLASGSVVKAVLQFRQPFWEERDELRDTAFLHDPDALFPTWWTMRPLRAPVLTAWAGGPKAVALAAISKAQLQRAAIESSAKLFGIAPRRLEGLIEHFHFHDWGSDPWARGAYSYVTVGGMTARSRLSKPIENTLFFAGEALDTSGQASTVAGALASGQRAARQMLIHHAG
jgi:monoamine oxidase